MPPSVLITVIFFFWQNTNTPQYMNPYPHLTHDGGELLFSPTAIGHRLVISTMTTTKENSEIVFYHKF